MRHWVTYPLLAHPSPPELVTGEAVARVARAAEAAGFDGIGFTDHPAPSHKWLSAGGHDALDPFAALSFVAAVTERLSLIPNIVVLPYRNPLVVAKAVATIDALSGGRFVLSVATGYLRSEYRALGADFDARNDRFDEAIEVLRGIWSTDDYSFTSHGGDEGAPGGFTVRGVTANPKPAKVPIWIGGNSRLTRRRVARYGDGWNPFPAPRSLAVTSRTAPLESLDDLAALLDDLWAQVDEAGRDPAGIDVAFGTCTGSGPDSPTGLDAAAELEALDRMAGLGVTWNGVGLPGDSVAHAVEALEQYGEEVIGR